MIPWRSTHAPQDWLCGVTDMKIIISSFIVLLYSSIGYADCFESFEELFLQIQINDDALADNTHQIFFIEELVYDSNNKLIEKRQIDDTPEKYKYEGRIIPNKTHQNNLSISLNVRRVLLNDIRVVTEKTPTGEEMSSYWFRRENACWKLWYKSVNLHK